MDSRNRQTLPELDEEAARTRLEKHFRAHYAELVAFATRYVSSSAAAEDVVQDVFLAFWRNQASVETSNVRAYLYRSVYHRSLNALRRARIERDLTPARSESVAGAADSELMARETNVAIRSAVESLPERCRMVFQLSREQGLTYPEIAQTLGISVKTVETQMGRALRSLREQLAPFRG